MIIFVLTFVLITVSQAGPIPTKKARFLIDALTQRVERLEKRIEMIDWLIIDHLANWKREMRLEFIDGHWKTNNNEVF